MRATGSPPSKPTPDEWERANHAAYMVGVILRYRHPAGSVAERFRELEAAGEAHNDAWFGTATMVRGWDQT